MGELSKAYWEGARGGRLVLQRCGRCHKVRHYPRLLCDACYSSEVEHIEASGRGTVHSWTVTHHVFDPVVASDTPYVLVTVDMAEGVRVLGRLSPTAQPRRDLPVRIAFEPGPDGLPLPTFAADSS